jgi:hypothetical protein
MRGVSRDRPYQSIGDVDAEWRGPSKAELRRQREWDGIREATAARPLPRPSPEAIHAVAAILRAHTAHPPPELMRWRLRLICGHLVEAGAHPDHHDLHAAFTGHRDCQECGQPDRVVVAAAAVGLMANPILSRSRAADKRPRAPLIVPVP